MPADDRNPPGRSGHYRSDDLYATVVCEPRPYRAIGASGDGGVGWAMRDLNAGY